MKNWLLLLLALCCFSGAFAAAEVCRVTARTLNVRSAPDKNAPVVSAVFKGTELRVEEFTSDGWAKIEWRGGAAYVSADYLEKTGTEEVGSKSSGGNPFYDFSGGHVPAVPRHWLIIAVLGLSVLLLLLLRSNALNYSLKWKLGVGLMVLLSGCEIYSVLMLGGDCVWFCMPDQVGFLGMIVNFFIFGLVVVNQYACYKALLYSLSGDKLAGGGIDWRLGIWSWPVAIVASLVLGVGYTHYVFSVFVLFQAGFMCWIMWKFAREGAVLTGIFTAFFYLGGIVAVLLVAFLFLPLLIIAGLVMLGLLFASECAKTASAREERYY